MQLLIAFLSASPAVSIPERSHPPTIVIYGNLGAARSELSKNCVILPTFSPNWLAKIPDIASFESHLNRHKIPRDWRRSAECDVNSTFTSSPPVFEWVVDELGGRVFRRTGDGLLSLFSTQKWLTDQDSSVRSSFLASLVAAERDAEIFSCVDGCQAFQVRWAQEPSRNDARAAIERILTVLGLPLQSEAALINAYLGEDVVLEKNVSISYSNNRWFVHNLARTEAIPLVGLPDFFFYPHPEGCKLTAPSAIVKAWEVRNGWLVNWKNPPARWSVPFKVVADAPGEECSLRHETVRVYSPTQLTGKPSVKSGLRPLLDVLQHRPLSSLPISARQRIVLRYTPQSGWNEEKKDLEVRFSRFLLQPPASCSPTDTDDGAYNCPLGIRIEDFEGFSQWY